MQHSHRKDICLRFCLKKRWRSIITVFGFKWDTSWSCLTPRHAHLCAQTATGGLSNFTDSWGSSWADAALRLCCITEGFLESPGDVSGSSWCMLHVYALRVWSASADRPSDPPASLDSHRWNRRGRPGAGWGVERVRWGWGSWLREGSAVTGGARTKWQRAHCVERRWLQTRFLIKSSSCWGRCCSKGYCQV